MTLSCACERRRQRNQHSSSLQCAQLCAPASVEQRNHPQMREIQEMQTTEDSSFESDKWSGKVCTRPLREWKRPFWAVTASSSRTNRTVCTRPSGAARVDRTKIISPSIVGHALPTEEGGGKERSQPRLHRAKAESCILGSECEWRRSRHAPPQDAAQESEGKPGRLGQRRAVVRRPNERRCWRAHCASAQPTLSQGSEEHRHHHRGERRPFCLWRMRWRGGVGAAATVTMEREASWSQRQMNIRGIGFLGLHVIGHQASRRTSVNGAYGS